MKLDLHHLAISIFSFCFNHNTELDIQWIPRTCNEEADYLSKIFDYDDWAITWKTFHLLNNSFRAYTVDCFADHKNHKLPKFFSRFWWPDTSGIDAFFQNWQGENCLLVPPIPLVSKTLIYMHQCHASGTLVAPIWPSAPFWPLLVSKFAQYINTYLVLVGNSALQHGNNKNSLLGSETWNGYIAAFHLDFAQLFTQ